MVVVKGRGGSRKRDLFVLFLFLFALLRVVEETPASRGVSFVLRWEISNSRSADDEERHRRRLTPPIVFFDLNGDGSQETLIAHFGGKVGIYDGSSRSSRLETTTTKKATTGEKMKKKKKKQKEAKEEENGGTKNLRLLKMVDVHGDDSSSSSSKMKKRRTRDERGKSVIAMAAGRPAARRATRTTTTTSKRRREEEDEEEENRKSSGTNSDESSKGGKRIVIKRKAIFVVVTEELRVMAFDHNAKKKWERSARDALFSGKIPPVHLHLGGKEGSIKVDEIAVTVVSARGEDEDGLVVVGGRVEHENFFHQSEEGGEDYERGMEAYERELDDDAMLSMHRGGRRDERIEFKEEGGVEDAVENDDSAFASQNGAFVYLAFNANSGEFVWRRVASDFVADPVELLRTTTPAHEVRLDSHLTKVEEHKSKTDGICRSYRESALAEALPHAWRDAEDTRMRSAPFSKSQKQTSSSFGGRSTGKRTRGRRESGPLIAASAATTNLKAASRDPNFAVADKTNDFSSLLSRGFSYLNLGKSAVHHRDDEREQLDYHNRRYHHQHMMSSTNNNIKNAIIAHHRDGVEVLDAFTGELICQLALQHPGYHADINGDGAIDHLDARGHRAHIADVVMDNFSPGCWASVTSGAPDVQTVFEGSICKPTRKSSIKSTPRQQAQSKRRQKQKQNSGDFYLRNKNKDDVDVLTPIIVRRDDKSERNRSFRRATKDAVFLNSRGELTCYAKDGTRRWMVNTRASWKIDVNGPPKDGIYDLFSSRDEGNRADGNDSKDVDRFVPTLATFKFRTHHRHHGVSHNNVVVSSTGNGDGHNRTNKNGDGGSSSAFLSQRSLFSAKQSRRHHTSEASLVVGSKRAVIVSPSGTKIATIFLPSTPIARAQVLDCNDDGKNDFIIRTETSTICYAQKSTSALSVYVVMLTSLVLSSFVAFVHQVEFESSSSALIRNKKDDDFYDGDIHAFDDESDSETSESSSNSESESNGFHGNEEAKETTGEEKMEKKEKRNKTEARRRRRFPTIKYFARSTDVDIKAD